MPSEEENRKAKEVFDKLFKEVEVRSAGMASGPFVTSVEKAAIETLDKADPSDIKAIGASQLELSAAYYHNPHRQSKISFWLCCIAAVVFLVSFVAAITLLILKQPANIAYISGIGSAISGVFSYIFSTMYTHASSQALAYKPQGDKIQQFILANSACELLDEERKPVKREDYRLAARTARADRREVALSASNIHNGRSKVSALERFIFQERIRSLEQSNAVTK
jgi:hypothetical protein